MATTPISKKAHTNFQEPLLKRALNWEGRKVCAYQLIHEPGILAYKTAIAIKNVGVITIFSGTLIVTGGLLLINRRIRGNFQRVLKTGWKSMKVSGMCIIVVPYRFIGHALGLTLHPHIGMRFDQVFKFKYGLRQRSEEERKLEEFFKTETKIKDFSFQQKFKKTPSPTTLQSDSKKVELDQAYFLINQRLSSKWTKEGVKNDFKKFEKECFFLKRKLHPDLHQGDEQFKTQFQEFSAAFDLIKRDIESGSIPDASDPGVKQNVIDFFESIKTASDLGYLRSFYEKLAENLQKWDLELIKKELPLFKEILGKIDFHLKSYEHLKDSFAQELKEALQSSLRACASNLVLLIQDQTFDLSLLEKDPLTTYNKFIIELQILLNTFPLLKNRLIVSGYYLDRAIGATLSLIQVLKKQKNEKAIVSVFERFRNKELLHYIVIHKYINEKLSIKPSTQEQEFYQNLHNNVLLFTSPQEINALKIKYKI